MAGKTYIIEYQTMNSARQVGVINFVADRDQALTEFSEANGLKLKAREKWAFNHDSYGNPTDKKFWTEQTIKGRSGTLHACEYKGGPLFFCKIVDQKMGTSLVPVLIVGRTRGSDGFSGYTEKIMPLPASGGLLPKPIVDGSLWEPEPKPDLHDITMPLADMTDAELLNQSKWFPADQTVRDEIARRLANSEPLEPLAEDDDETFDGLTVCPECAGALATTELNTPAGESDRFEGICEKCGRVWRWDDEGYGFLGVTVDVGSAADSMAHALQEEEDERRLDNEAACDKIKALESEIAALKAQRHRIVVDCGPSGMIDDFWADLDVELVVLQYHIPIGLEPSDGYIKLDGNDVVVEVRDAEYWKLMPAPDSIFDLVDAGLTFPPEDDD